MSQDEKAKEIAKILLSQSIDNQRRFLNQQSDDEQRRVLLNFPQERREQFLQSLPAAEYIRYTLLLGTLEPEPIPEPPRIHDKKKHTDDDDNKKNEEIPVVHAQIVGQDDRYKIYQGRLKGYLVRKVRKINPVVWVCEVLEVQHNPNQINLSTIPRGVEVLVHTNDMFELLPEDYAEINAYYDSSNLDPVIQQLKIGSWNIRCTGEFQKSESFFTDLLERFARLAKFIVKSECHIVALQEFPMNFNHNENNLKIKAHLLLPEFVNKLNAVQDEEWGFGFCEDFPQEHWREHRNVKDANGVPVPSYQSKHGEYIQAFVFKKRYITMHSVEQVLDLNYQENRFRHAPIIGRFSFLTNFHFSLINVHLRPFSARTNSRFEIEDLGKCLKQLRKYNPDSTIVIGDFNMAAARFALDESTTERRRNTEFEPYVASQNVWDSFHAEGYRHVVINQHTNTSTENPKQFDNIWLPKELYPKAVIKRNIAPVPPDKAQYERSESVLHLQDVFVGETGRQFINQMTDHHLVFVNLRVDVSQDDELIKSVFEINNLLHDLSSREYNGFEEPKEKPQPPTPEPESQPDPPSEQKFSRKDAKKHFHVWNKVRTRKEDVTIDDMERGDGKIHWATNLFPKNLLEKPKGDKSKTSNWAKMKKLETEYFECKERVRKLQSDLEALQSTSDDEVDTKEKQKSIKKAIKALEQKMDEQLIPDFERLANAHFSEYIQSRNESDESDQSEPTNKKLFDGNDDNSKGGGRRGSSK